MNIVNITVVSKACCAVALVWMCVAGQTAFGQPPYPLPLGWGWSPHRVANDASLVVCGTLGNYFGKHLEIGGHPLERFIRVYRVHVDRVLKGVVPEKELYVITGVPEIPPRVPLLFTGKPYILFLQPIQDNVEHTTDSGVMVFGPSSEQTKEVMKLLNMPESLTYGVCGNWAGAVSLDPRWLDRANHEIYGAYKLTDPEYLREAIEVFCKTVQVKEPERKKAALEQLKNRGGLYEAFAEKGLKQMTEPDAVKGQNRVKEKRPVAP